MHGLTPQIVHSLLNECPGAHCELGGIETASGNQRQSRAIYEFVQEGGHIQPRLRLRIASDDRNSSPSVVTTDSGTSTAPPQFGSRSALDSPEPPTESDVLMVSKLIPRTDKSILSTIENRSAHPDPDTNLCQQLDQSTPDLIPQR